MTALVIGESVLDVVHAPGLAPVERPGGSAVNVAVALARLGATGPARDVLRRRSGR
jgi:sugar/nucleoside kinase (ribokinase family)